MFLRIGTLVLLVRITEAVVAKIKDCHLRNEVSEQVSELGRKEGRKEGSNHVSLYLVNLGLLENQLAPSGPSNVVYTMLLHACQSLF